MLRARLATAMVAIALAAGCKSRKASAPPATAAFADAGAIDAFAMAIDEDKDAYVPAEFKAGADRWRDTGIYVDGKFYGLLAWAELPVALKPIWIPVKASAPKRYGTDDKGWRWAKERRYRFRDLVTTLGLDLSKVKELHAYGPKFSETIVATGRDLRSKAADEFYFRFGGHTSGKAIPTVPDKFGNDRSPDKISAVMIYIDKTPPILERNVGLVLDGEVQTGVPYFGTPLRGGVRVYLDDHLVSYIKRQDLPATTADASSGEPRWKLFEYLQSHDVKLDGVVEAWVIRDEKWAERFDRSALDGMWFAAGPQAKGNIELSGQAASDPKVKAQAIQLRTHALTPAEIPAPDPEEL
jgi:hypothetical protein